MKSLQEFLAEHLDKLILTTAQKLKEKALDENSRGKKLLLRRQSLLVKREIRKLKSCFINISNFDAIFC